MTSGARCTVSGASSRTAQLIQAIAGCVPKIGLMAYTQSFLDAVRVTGAGQVTAFGYEQDQANCLLSRNFLSEEKGGTLAATYVDGWFRDDPLFKQVMEMGEDGCAVRQLEDLLPCLSPSYFAMFFGGPGFRTKVAVLVAQPPLKMALNLYFEGSPAGSPRDALEANLYGLLGRTLATHFLRLNLPEFPLPLAVLSERERQVCVGMLEGKKAEIIAEEIGVGTSSVVTYRQRAYQKLGISSRGQLFSICRG